MQIIQAAVIGIHGIGQLHGETMAQTGRIKVCAICDIDEQLRGLAQEKFPEAQFYNSSQEMYRNEQLDLVTSATPHNVHAPLAIEALQAGVNVIVEKPMATSYSDARAMIKTAAENERFVTVFHNRRWDGWFLAAKTVINDGLLGHLCEINIAINQRFGPATWRGYKEKCGGVTFDWGVHLVDYALRLANSPVKAVSGYFYRSPDSRPDGNEDHGAIRIYFESGAIANMTISSLSQHQPPRYRIIGDKGTLLDEWEWKDEGKLKVFTRLSGGESAVMEVGYRQTAWKHFYDNVAAHILDGAPLLVTAESAAENINVLCTAERSHERGGVPMPLE